MPIALSAASAAMHGAMVPIATQEITGSTTQGIIFSGIPQVYQDLFIVTYGRSQRSASTSETYYYINNDSGSNYSQTRLLGNGSAAISDRNTSQGVLIYGEVPAASSTSGIFGSNTMHILNYANTATFKTVLSRNAVDLNGSGFVHLRVNLWRSTSAVNKLDIYNTNAEYWTVGTRISIYGVRSVGQ
jgi:hypothetical protein